MSESDERHFLTSSHREKVVEHVFLGELLRHLWNAGISGIQVLKPEVDASGYDLVLSIGKVIRHLQIKASVKGARATGQTIHDSLADHPSGCVVWIVLTEDLGFDQFLWFGGEPGEPLPDLARFRQAKHTKANSQGVKTLRQHSRTLPKGAFAVLPDMQALVERLFGPDVGQQKSLGKEAGPLG